MILRPWLSRTRRLRKSRNSGPVKLLLKDAEAQRAGVGDRGDHVGLEALAGAVGDRGLADRRPGPAGGVIGAQPGLVGPEDLGALAPRALLDRRVVAPQASGAPPRQTARRRGASASAGSSPTRADSARPCPRRPRRRARWRIRSRTSARVHKNPGSLSWSGFLPATRAAIFCCSGSAELGVPAAPTPPPARQAPDRRRARCAAHPVTDRLARDTQQARDLGLRAALAHQTGPPSAVTPLERQTAANGRPGPRPEHYQKRDLFTTSG